MGCCNTVRGRICRTLQGLYRFIGQRLQDLSALHSAAYLGHVRVLEALLDAGASPCARNGAGELPIDRFVEEDEDEVAKEFQEDPVVEENARRRVFALLQG